MLLGACLDVNAAGEAPHLQTIDITPLKHGEGWGFPNAVSKGMLTASGVGG